MPTVIGHHDISKGKDHWLASPKREELFGPLGVTNIRTFVNPQDPTQVAVLMDVADMDALMGAMQSDAAAQAICDGQPILADAAVRLRRHCGRQLRHEPVLVAPVEQVTCPEHVEVGIDDLRADDRHECIGFLPTRDPQYSWDRP